MKPLGVRLSFGTLRGAPTSAAEVYDGAWTIVGGMHVARRGHTATLLSNGRILIAGGDTGSGPTGVLESFDPETGIFTVLSAELAFPRSGHAAAALRDGRVVLAGGAGEEGLLASTAIFDPASGSLLAGPALSLARSGLTATALIDGTVLLAGGSAASGQASLAEIHDGSAIRAAGSMLSARAFHLAITMPGAGKILMTSGRRRGKMAELYVPWTETFEPAGKLHQSRSSATGAAAGLDGLLMVAGGRGSGRILKSSELYRYSTVRTGKDDYPPGESVVMTGGGWEPGETVSLLLEEDPFTHGDIVLTAVADAAGRFRNAEFAPAEHDIGTRFYLTATGEKSRRTAQTTFTDGFPAGNLDQCENGSVANFLSGGTSLPCTGANWVNGNVNGQKAHYVEGDFVSYRLHLTGLNGETSVTTTIEWDITKQARHALDYIGQWNDPNSGDPCGDLLSAAECAAQPAPAPIPADTAKAPPAGVLSGGVMRLYGDASASISFGSYVGVNEGTDNESRRIQMTISKTAATDELVLAWGGHISDFEDWNPVGDEGELTASAISGSPYHMRLIEVNGKGGNQDRSLSTSAIILDGTLTVFKEVINDDGGAAAPGDFSIHVQSAAGEVPGSPAPGVPVSGGGTSYMLPAGTYAVSEDVHSGYLLAGFSGDCDSSGIVTVVPGGSSTCTITNDDIAPKLTVTKIVVNDDGGTKQVADFALFVDGGPVTSGSEGTFSAGAHTVSETSDPGYAATIGGDCAADGSVTLNPGDVKACTITNDDIAAKLTVIKIVVNDDGGTKQVADFPLCVDGGPVTSGAEGAYSAGAHTVSETADPGYAATIGGDCAADGSVTLNPGDVKACTITNDDIAAKLSVTKIVVNDDGGTKQVADFPLFIDGTSVTSGSEGTFSAGAHTVSETADPGYAATIGGDCAADGSVTLNLGDVKICTITNDDVAPKLTVTKIVVNDDGGTKQVADFPLFVDGGSVTSGSEGAFSAGAHTVSETTDPGYAATIGGDCAADGSVTLNPGDVKACTITNDDIAAKLSVTKIVVNDDGGTKQVADFPLFVDGGPVTSGAESALSAGAHTVSETADPGYAATIGGDCAADGSVTLNPGDVKACTITNDDIAANLTVTKIVINDDGGTKQVADFALFVDGGPVTSGAESAFSAGAHTVSETSDPGYAATIGGDCAADGSVTLNPGDVKACTITNDDINDDDATSGLQKTIGFWKTHCDPSLLPRIVGQFMVKNCDQAVLLLDKRDQAGNNQASDAAYGLAAQLLAALLNKMAGNGCAGGEENQAVNDAWTLLSNLGFSGSGSYLPPRSHGQRALALSLANTLDTFNNGLLCQ